MEGRKNKFTEAKGFVWESMSEKRIFLLEWFPFAKIDRTERLDS